MEALIFAQIVEGKSVIEIAKKISEIQGVSEVLLISGQWDLMVRFSYETMDQLSNFVVSELRKEEGVGKTDTTIVLSRVK